MAAAVSGFRVPLLDLDRQSLIVQHRGALDCRISVWWQPSDAAWYASLECPVNTPIVRGKRLVVNGGILDRIPGVLPGNIILRAIDEDSAVPRPSPRRLAAADAWRSLGAELRQKKSPPVGGLLAYSMPFLGDLVHRSVENALLIPCNLSQSYSKECKPLYGSLDALAELLAPSFRRWALKPTADLSSMNSVITVAVIVRASC